MTKRTDIITKVQAALLANPGQFTSDLQEVLGLSISRTREILAGLAKDGIICRNHQDVDGCKVLVYTLPASTQLAAQPTAKKGKGKGKGKAKDSGADLLEGKKLPPAAKEVRARKATTGLGHPNAKKIVNPQNTLELKKTAVKEAGGKMVWTNRKWVIGEVSVESRVLAAMTIEEVVALV